MTQQANHHKSFPKPRTSNDTTAIRLRYVLQSLRQLMSWLQLKRNKNVEHSDDVLLFYSLPHSFYVFI